MAKVSSHLRNFAVAEVIGYIALLDGHPKIVGRPIVQTGPAQNQQGRGTVENPFSHVVPSDILMNGDRLVDFYRSREARTQLDRVFGMGVLAPEDWQTQAAFGFQPRQQNVVDHYAERYQRGGGLVEAFQACAEAAVLNGRWDASAERRHSFGSLTNFIAEIYRTTWIPAARAAYTSACSHYATQLLPSRDQDSNRLKIVELRAEIATEQKETFEQDVNISPAAALNVWKSSAAERWSTL